MTKRTVLKLSAIALTVGLMSGCATTDQMKADIAAAQDAANAALSAAKAAQLSADDADRKATAAMNAANAAQASADECAEKCDRMMNKAMAK